MPGGLFNRSKSESRSASFQAVWGAGGDWERPSAYSATDALGLWAVTACIRHRVNLLSQLPLVAYRDDPVEGPIKLPIQPKLIKNPSGTVVRAAWMTQLSVSRDIWGNAFGSIIARDGAGYPTQVEWLPPASVVTSQSVISGGIEYTVNGRPFPAFDMLVIPSTFNIPGSPLGTAPLFYSGLVDLGKRAQQFGADWFRNGAVPSSIIYSETDLTNDQANHIRDRVTRSWRNRKPGVLGAGLRLEHVKVSENESQFNETIQTTAGAIASVFGVPLEEIGVSSGKSTLTYANRTDAKQASIDRMHGDIVLVQEILTNQLTRPTYVEFNTNAYLRSDTATRYSAYQTGLAAGFLTVDEVRELEGLSPLAVELAEDATEDPTDENTPDQGDTPT